jgi:uncharacterized membrane protein
MKREKSTRTVSDEEISEILDTPEDTDNIFKVIAAFAGIGIIAIIIGVICFVIKLINVIFVV